MPDYLIKYISDLEKHLQDLSDAINAIDDSCVCYEAQEELRWAKRLLTEKPTRPEGLT